MALEGLARHASTHAAGVVISQEPLMDHVPLYKRANDEIVTQYTMTDLEKIGLVKFDFLGLKTLTMIHRRRRDGQQRKPARSQPPLDIDNLPLDDPEDLRDSQLRKNHRDFPAGKFRHAQLVGQYQTGNV